MPISSSKSSTFEQALNFQVGVQDGLGIGGQSKGVLLGQGVTLGEAGVSGFGNEVSYSITSTTLDPNVAIAAIEGSNRSVEQSLDVVKAFGDLTNEAIANAGSEARQVALASLPYRSSNAFEADSPPAINSGLVKKGVGVIAGLVIVGFAIYYFKK